jgi:hypothetical protein
MLKKIFTVLAVILFIAPSLNAQWTNEGAFPDTSFKGGTHGIAVDPDGKVWVSSYYKDVNWVGSANDTIATAGILVFNADGTQAPFSPISVVTTGSTIDTLKGNCRGMDIDELGNIIYVQSGPNKAIKINYKTGAGMARKLLTEPGSSPTGPSVSSDGTIFIGPVVGGGTTAIAMYDKDLNYLGNAVTGPPAISRILEVSPDGRTIYWLPFTAQKAFVYTRADEFSAFALTDSFFEGMSIEGSAWNPKTGNLWVSNDNRNGTSETTGYKHLTWYEWDIASKKFVNYFTWNPTTDATEFPRGFAFSPDGMTAYAGTFTVGSARIQKFENTGSVGVDEVSNSIPSGYSLEQNYPNPFNPSTIIKFTVPQNEIVKLKVYNMLGQEIATLVNEFKAAGTYEVNFNASHLASGMYVYTLNSGKFNISKKMLLVK